MDDLPCGAARPASQHGWLRRRELDTPAGLCWERPDGTLTLLDRDRAPEVIEPAPKRKRTAADYAYLAWRAKRDGSA